MVLLEIEEIIEESTPPLKRKAIGVSDLKLFLKLNSFVEVKKVRVKRSFHLVPFQIPLKRRSYLIIKWLMQAIKSDKRNVTTVEKLAFEIEQTLKTDTSKSLKLRNLNITTALANRSNLHYRW